MAKPVTGMRAFTSHERRLIRSSLIAQYGLLCQICKEQGKSDSEALISTESTVEDNSFSIDHIVPLADGGPNTRQNMWPTHVACNERKGSSKMQGRVRSNRKPRTGKAKPVTQVTSPRLAYSSSSW
jgi:5-methylcytosine-specific restriction endonuclease McrA